MHVRHESSSTNLTDYLPNWEISIYHQDPASHTLIQSQQENYRREYGNFKRTRAFFNKKFGSMEVRERVWLGLMRKNIIFLFSFDRIIYNTKLEYLDLSCEMSLELLLIDNKFS